MGRPRIGFRRPCPNPDRSLRRRCPDAVDLTSLRCELRGGPLPAPADSCMKCRV
jgi:hypothetical protein